MTSEQGNPPSHVSEPGLPPALSELAILSDALKSSIPANPNSPENQTHSERLERVLVSYFTKVERGMPWGRLAAIYNRNVEE